MKRDPETSSGTAEVPPVLGTGQSGAKEAIAIIGFALKFPQDVTSEEGLWKLLMERRTTKTEVPSNRWNLDGFYKPHGNRPGTVTSRGGHFIVDDPARFDAPFFSIQPAEAECMDPQQRFLLETSYHALENAGIPMESAMGTRTSVHVGCLLQEYSQISQRDTDMPGTYQIVGSSGLSMLANRLSWFYNFTGPSMTVDTACSGSLLAVHLACQDLLAGSVDMALACGSNLSLVPDSTALLSALNMMSPDSTSYSFDERANGYSKSEGFGVVLLKRFSQAISDGDTIRGIIRSTGCNQDGHTPGITQPSQAAQERLTQETYQRAGLDLDVTRYFEAHGTGTMLGDPTEAGAISNAFTTRTAESPLFIGALKSNIGHPEAASGIASIIKTALVLEAGIIPPNMYPERISPSIAANCPNLKFPLTATTWPTEGVRRASVNSFGYGGTNVHVVMDDVLSYVESQKLSARHCTRSLKPQKSSGWNDHENLSSRQLDRGIKKHDEGDHLHPGIETSPYKLLVLSAFDDRAVQRNIASHEEWFHNRAVTGEILADLAYTLTSKRSSFPWKTYCIASPESVSELSWSRPARAKQNARLCFVLTGQGATWHGMGRELCGFNAFRQSILHADQHLRSLGSRWSAADELYNLPTKNVCIHQPELSQALCTIVQVAIVDLLSTWNIRASAIVGHSSGEIAAAYASGAISCESAWMLAYFRGLAVVITRDLVKSAGSMVAVQATPNLMEPLLEQQNLAYTGDPLVIACYNSPSSLTISGSRDAVDRLINTLMDAKIKFTLLDIDVAYHSDHMDPVGAVYGRLLRPIQSGRLEYAQPHFISTVTGKLLEDNSVLRTSEYWVRNLVSPVKFSSAVTEICAAGAKQSSSAMADMFVEIGPHSLLRSPLRDILKPHGRDIETDYVSVLVRNRAADLTALDCVGKLHSAGSLIDLAEINGNRTLSERLVTTLPPYPFNDKTKYWLEGRASAQYRFRKHAHHEFLGTRVDDWNACEARWTNRILLEQSPWLKDHQVNGMIIFPASGFIVMALEAVRQIYGNKGLTLGYSMRDINFPKAVALTQKNRGTELQLTLRTAHTQPSSVKSGNSWDQFTIFVYETDGWVECCSGEVAVEYEREHQPIPEIDEREESLDIKMSSIKTALEICRTCINSSDIYDAFERAGLLYGPYFRALEDVRCNENGQAIGLLQLEQWKSIHESFADPHLIHPTALDGILQMTFPAYSIYAKNASATTVPIGFRSVWFSEDFGSASSKPKVLVHARVTERGYRNKVFQITAALADSKKPCFSGEMETATIGSSSASSDPESKPLYRIEYKPDFDFLPSRTLFLDPDPTKDPNLIHDKDMLCLTSIRSTLDDISDVPDFLPAHMHDYVQWMKLQAEKYTGTTAESVESLCQRLEHMDVEARLLVRVAKNLPSILAGEVDPLNLLFADEILSDFYSNFHSNQELLSRAAEEIDLLAHKFPAMRVLEIGAGTGSATEHILSALGNRVAEYVYTDVTPSFFLKARERFSSSNLTFKTLNISQDPLVQGYKDGTSRNQRNPEFAETMPNSLGAEWPNPPSRDDQSEASPESARNNSPLLTESEWADVLLETGFSGMDVCISDAGYITEKSVSSIMISRAVVPPESTKTTTHVIFDDSSKTQNELLRHLEESAVERGNVILIPVPWRGVLEQDLSLSTCLFITDSEGDLLGQLQAEDLLRLKGILVAAEALLWITFHASAENRSPAEGLVPGLARTLATENEDCRVVSITLDPVAPVSTTAGSILEIMHAYLHAQGVPEDEYVEQDGLLCIPRVIKDRVLSSHIFSRDQTVTKPWSELDSPNLTIGSVGRLNTLHFEQVVPSSTPLGSDDVVIKVEAVGLSSRDLLVAQGQIHEEVFGSECAGVVLQLGSSPTHNYKVGDRVFGVVKNALAKVVRCKSFQLQKVETEMEMCEAATYPVAFCTALYALVYCARAKERESILIHRGASEVGQAIIQIAKLHGCEVFATVDSAHHATFLHQTFNIPQSHIFSSHTLDFGKGLRRLTHGHGVDVVVNSLLGEAARESWECLATFGRFVDIGETASATNLPLGRSRTFVGVNIQELAQCADFGAIFGEVARLIESKKITPPTPLRVFRQSEVEKAFRLLQSEETTSRVAIQMASDEVVPMVLAPTSRPLFDPEASYLLAGGFGGIGRSLALWMVQNGVKHLVLPSRTIIEGSGDTREELVQELRAQGADVRAPLCDIADSNQLEETLRSLSGMPPIKGCIQAAMKVRDSSFANMSLADWHASLSPKLAGSWNLHRLLPPDLNFFIMFSSSTGIMGSFGQSNYTAGNTYQDALAAHRVQHGQLAHSIAMSMVAGVGWVAENAQVQALLKVRGMLEEVSLDDIYELLRYCCNPGYKDVGSQIITPLSLPADLRALGIIEPLGSTRPIYSYLHTLPSRYEASTNSSCGQESKKLPSFSLQDAKTLNEATEIITEAIQTQLSSLLVVSKDDIDPKKPIHKYGVDSLVAVEMRNWFAKGVGADVGTIEILGDAGIAELAGRVAMKSKFVKEELKA
ncbi:polyketide synthase-like protein [Clathrospora elynae]|uniref:Polyketide synthase-like protein n=1 Tax=Clathrospora elynae TaxID=706981 RepID=A0A6A5T467_9PLEO|nr:polyketide synthase-like protein [Clathrospora elynae]